MTVAGSLSSVSGDADTCVIRLDENAGLQAAAELHTALAGAAGRGIPRVIVELAGAFPVDSTVLGVLLAGLRRFERAGAELVLVAARGLSTGTAVDSLRLDRFFHIERALDDALGDRDRPTRRRRSSHLRSDVST